MNKTDEILLQQLVDDFGQLIGQVQLLTQRVGRVEDLVKNLSDKTVRDFRNS